MQRRNGWVARVAFALALLSLAACERGGGGGAAEKDEAAAKDSAAVATAGAPVGTLPQGVSAEQGEEGRALYGRACIMCHGEKGEGTQLGPALTDGQWAGGRSGTFEEITQLVREGIPEPADSAYAVPMPPRGDGSFTDEQIRAVAAYTYSIAARR